MARVSNAFAPLVVAGVCAAQSATVVHFPQPAGFYQNSSFTVVGSVLYVPTTDADVLWSVSLTSGALVDPDGLALPSPGLPSNPYAFAVGRIAIPGWFPSQSVLVADITDPADLVLAGVISLPPTTNVQGQNIEVDPTGRIGFVAGFPDDTLYSFDVLSMSVLDALPLPGNPDRIARAGDRIAMVDTLYERILVADVSDPANMGMAGVIPLPAGTTFGSNDDIVFAADGRTGFVSSNQRVLYSFDAQTVALLDPDGVTFGSSGFGDDVAIHGNVVACGGSNGLSFVDASDPRALRILSEAAFGGLVASQGDATVAFSADGLLAAFPIIYPSDEIRVFDVATGVAAGHTFPVDPQPNFIARLGASDGLGALCANSSALWLIDGLLEPNGIATYCTAKVNSCGSVPAIVFTGTPSVAATSGFEIAADGARSGRAGILVYGRDVAATPFQGGTLCIASSSLRRGPRVVASGGTGACDARFALDMNAFASGAAGGYPAPFLRAVGEHVMTQWWGRDTGANGSFLSDALRYVVAP